VESDAGGRRFQPSRQPNLGLDSGLSVKLTKPFGLLDAIAIRLQGVRVVGVGEVPVQLIQALPYLLTVILLAGFIGKAVAPKAAGIPYGKER